jgi:hypothetical protein
MNGTTGDKIMKLDTILTSEVDEGYEQRYPLLGLIPRSRGGQIFLAWAAVNVILTLLPVFNIYGNSRELGVSGMPTTVFYSYCVFTLNSLLGAVYFLTRGLAWAELNQTGDMEGGE